MKSTPKRKRLKGPTPLGVLEFSSALNGDDPILILKKLHQFVNVVGYERRVALSPLIDAAAHGDGRHRVDEAGGNEKENDVESSDEESILSIFDDDDTTEPSTKHQKLNDGDTNKKTPSWTLDKNNYQVPFVGTSVSKGATGSVTHNVWPTGFLEVYRNHSPSGVELVSNDFISAVPPNNGIHRSLCKDSEFSLVEHGEGDNKRKGGGGSSNIGGQTRGQIISMTLQSNYWMALSEWILGFVPMDKLKKELSWEDGLIGTTALVANDAIGDNKCAVPPPIMTILMKNRLPEWIDAIHKYTRQQHVYALRQQKEKQQLKKQNKKKQQLLQQQQSKGEHNQPVVAQERQQQQQDQKKLEKRQEQMQKRQQREETLLLSALGNFIALCHLSNGTAREVLRKLTIVTVTSSGGAAKSGTGGPNARGGKFGGANKPFGGGSGDGGTSWMVRLFQQQQGKSTSPSHQPQMECLRLVCTLLETKDYTIVSRLTEVPPAWLLEKQGGGNKNNKGSFSSGFGGENKKFGLAYIALRYGIQRLLELEQKSDGQSHGKDDAEKEEDMQEQGQIIDMYAKYTARLLRNVRDILLPPSRADANGRDAGGTSDGKKGFVLGIGATADLLSGEVLNNLTKLSLLAPPFYASAESIQAIVDGNDTYEDLSPIEAASVESRRLLFLLLADSHRSPFLYGIHHKATSAQSTNAEEQKTSVYLAQLSKALHGILQGGSSMKLFLGTCLTTTPELVPHFFRGLQQLSDPKPTYRSLKSLTFVENVLREAPTSTTSPLPQTSLEQQQQLLAMIIPSCVTKNLLGKIIQSQSALMVSSGLKLIITTLGRAHACISAYGVSDGVSEQQLKSSVSEALMRHHLPEVSLLFSIPSRFDPFVEHDLSNSATSSRRSNAIVVLQLCEAVQCYAQLDPSLMANVKFDWARLVPIIEDQQEQGFFCAEPLLQHRILETLLVVSRLSQDQTTTTFSSKMLPNVISILVSTRIPEVYTMARKLALTLMEREIFSQVNEPGLSVENNEAAQCHKYESSLWIDGISVDIVQELVASIEESKQSRVQNKIMISQAWSHASLGCAMPSLGVSSLLSYSICQLLGSGDDNSSLSNKMSLLLIQIATKMLLFQVDPKPFAAIIAFCTHGGISVDKVIAGLSRVANSILDDAGSNTIACMGSLSSDVFLPESCLNSIIQTMNAKKNSKCTRLDTFRYADDMALRQCLSMVKYSGEENERLGTQVRNIIISILETGDNVSSVVSPLLSMFTTHSMKPSDMQTTMILLLSATRSKRFDLRVKSLLDCDNTTEADTMGMGVVSELLRCSTIQQDNPLIADIWRYSSSALQSNDTCTSSLRDFLLMIMMHTMPAKHNSKQSSPFTQGDMFDLWSLIAGNLTSGLSVEFCLQLEDCLAALFETMDGQGTWDVYQRVCRLTPKVFVNLSLNTLRERKDPGSDSGSTLLQSVLAYDCTNFSCLSSLFASIDTDSKMVKLWDSGRLDLTAATFVIQTYKQKGASETITSEFFAEAAGLIGRRFLSLLSQQTFTNEVTLGIVLGVVEALCSSRFILHETQQAIIEILNHLENDNKVLAIDHEIKMLNLAVCVGSSLKNQGLGTSLLQTKAFMRCCKMLPKHIKKMLRTKREAETGWVESLVHAFSSLIKNAQSFDEETVTMSSNVIDNCIIACLKYGMMESNEESSSSVLGGCMKCVRLLMVQSHSPGSPTQVGLGSLTSSQVHAMAASHSSFQSALSASTTSPLVSDENGSGFCEGLTQQLELIQLLLCTISISANHVKIENETLMAILSVYNASTCIVDRLLRRLMFLYERNGSCKDEIIMNNLRWGDMAAKHINNVGEDESWEWFIDALELDRIRSTLSQFPVADTLEPAPFSNVECATNTDNKNKQDKQFGISAQSDDETDNDSISSVEGSSVTPQEITQDLFSSLDVGNDQWRGADDDPRYSPGFILSLILATLEAHLPLPPEQENSRLENREEIMIPDEDITYKNEEEISRCQAFGNICRRVSERGGIALAVASLSSRCPSMRKVSVSICGLFLKALQMQESHGIKLWRERPQQEMIMSSIQRGLAVRRSIQIQKYEAQDGIELGHKYNVPMLPAVSAVFLAKVLLVLAKPGDDMYGQMNRYFLRLADYHGAFQDCFGLPAFLSLYCSSSDVLTRCKTERNWALLTLKDAAVDEFCYRIISQHHVPELIMSSFDGLIDNPESKSELYLTIDVIESLIQSGGTRASNHLIKRQGLLSWLHGIISWRTVSSVFPYEALKCRFLKLIATAVGSFRCAKCPGDDETMDALSFYEKVPLASAVIKTCLDGDTVGSEGDISPESSTALLRATCNALWAIYLADKESQIESTSQGSTTLRDSASILKKFVCHEDMFGKVLASMCDLPLVNNGNDLASAKLFCGLALGFILEKKMQILPDTFLLSLKRVHELMKLHPCLGDDSKILRQVMECRHMAVLIGGIRIWDLFLPFLDDSAQVLE